MRRSARRDTAARSAPDLGRQHRTAEADRCRATRALYDARGPVGGCCQGARRQCSCPDRSTTRCRSARAWQGLFGRRTWWCSCGASTHRSALALIEKHRVDRVALRTDHDAADLEAARGRAPRARRVLAASCVMTGSAPCPAWVMRAFIEWLGPDVMHEAFGRDASGSAARSSPAASGWRIRARSAGRSATRRCASSTPRRSKTCRRARSARSVSLPPSGPGSDRTATSGASPTRRPRTAGRSVGDMGRFDADGYLYPRRPAFRHDPVWGAQRLSGGGRGGARRAPRRALELRDRPARRRPRQPRARDRRAGRRASATTELRATSPSAWCSYKVPRELRARERAAARRRRQGAPQRPPRGAPRAGHW